MENLSSIFLLLIIMIAVKYDIKERRIPNFITFPAIIVGVFFSLLLDGYPGILFSLSGLAMGMMIFLIPFAMGGMGAGDVKLMGAIGAIMGWKFVLLSGLFTAIIGGIISIGYFIVKGGATQAFINIAGALVSPLLYFIYLRNDSARILGYYEYFKQNKISTSKVYIPYGISIGAGTLLALVGEYWGYTL